MPTKRLNDPIEPMTLQNMRENGVRSIASAITKRSSMLITGRPRLKSHRSGRKWCGRSAG
jgi:hypothetical protein